MKLEILDNQRKNVFHLLHSFRNEYENMPVQHTRLIGQAFKSDPLFVRSLNIETLAILCLNNNNYNFETNVPVDISAIAEAKNSAKWNPAEALKMVENELMDVATCLQRILLNRMMDLDLLTDKQIEAFNTWNCITPDSLLAELTTDVDDFNPIHASYFVANSIYNELKSYFMDRIK